ncbi:hypothetical protein [Pseudomonas fulva]|uniref:hypothetical protein n=1 Tax=Pseudomonas fulva TaxID=47880 RepID=UPI00384F9A47
MISRIRNTLSLLTILVATSAAAQQSEADSFPHLAKMSHQTMTYNGKVVYEADVDQNDPNPKAFVLRIQVDEYPSDCANTVKNVSVSKDEGEGKNTMIGCVVTELSADGKAKADVVYTIQDKKKNVNKSGHVKANLEVGKEYKTQSNGSQVTLLLQTY